MRRYFFKPTVDSSVPPKICEQKKSRWIRPAAGPPSFSVDGSFVFLNKNSSLKDVGWDGPECTKLWRYNQHYFDDLNSGGSNKRTVQHVDLLDSWIASNIPGIGVGWDPYPTSIRIVNWIKWNLSSNQLLYRHLSSLAIQVRWLEKTIEWHLLGNHLFANAKALVFAGLFFEGQEAENWLKTGLKILKGELQEQVLSDGGHFELSPMYHCIFLEDILDLINLFRASNCRHSAELLPILEEKVILMFGWLQTMCHPDEQIPFFNDAALDVAKSPAELKKYAKRLNLFEAQRSDAGGLSVEHLRASGYVKLGAPEACLLLDVAALGPDYLPGHGHADSLSFEMSLFGDRVFVNSGVSQYEPGPIRHQERSTDSHNTVEVDAINSSQVWSGFRVARRARPFGLDIDQRKEKICVNCSHDGYVHHFGGPIHTRLWSLSHQRLLIVDRLKGKFGSAHARFILHPDIEATPVSRSRWRLEKNGLNNSINFRVFNGTGVITCATYSPEFGKRQETTSIKVIFDYTNEICVEISWNANEKS